VTAVEVRKAAPGDLAGIAAVALANGQGEEWGGADPAYVTHLLTHGTVVVGVSAGSVTGFGATRDLATGAGPVSMLCDLFVDPAAHDSGCGRAMLAELWSAPGPRMTFASLHASALPLYASFGVDAWWPLLYLHGPVNALVPADGWRAGLAGPADVARMELAWTGADRSDDHLAWARRPGGASVLARRGDQVLAAGTVGGACGEYGVTHLAVAPAADAAAALLAVLASLECETARVCLPGPHPAVRPLLAAGWRVAEFDLFMATDPTLLDPRRTVPSPALA
jgi:hypothetical protein